MSRILFTSDTHFGHENVIRFCKRPFENATQMDTAMIEMWNSVVSKNDTVYHLGDFAFRCPPERVQKIFRKLNGHKHLIIGNHDRKPTITLPWASRPEHMKFVTVDGIKIVLCHYALRVWSSSHHGSLHFYGHSHANLPGNSQSVDVGVDEWNYMPVDLPTIQAKLATLQEYGLRGVAPEDAEVDEEVEEAPAPRM